MTALFTIVLLAAQAPPASLDQIRADQNLEHRARTAIDFATAAEHNAEAAYSKGDLPGVTAELKNMSAAVELANESLRQTGHTPMRHPGPYKYGELRTQEMLIRLGDLDRRMEADERLLLEAPRNRIQEIHDAWFEGIMSKKK